ncbi:TonB-dependent receptor [Elizabethkingia meningoseptica]|uniref:TonB-dependent receptor plug domain-containing protein n=1 Tax=Elizabethkingia meningoseptica TaxID=238 RepID=UPI000332D09F|nr:TonB-dependent receptor [Elizabethkingia meningoseptica]AQX06696.1 TonB-dependent receptor [Elizabethkingia meningoseptica]AQX48744.1 TonB-dependent receptor [Elizabethkingia meningoseptica]EOR28739.1 putative TonB-dependent outer membrane siderophore receptor [Elizabethkingia meningoseptica ATCC 13253 = NBRC 12535]KUY14829.1 TonB-dependent receptor [Elizabethkingia meningoseptica]OPB69800.1 TonB-dependent receptor [Elizabethkingia meningoseptica]
MTYTNHKKPLTLGVVCFLAGSLSIYAQEKDTLKSKTIEEVKITIGSRNKARVATDTPVPIDVINIGQQSILSPQTDLTQILNYAAPSFTSNSSTVADGTDHIDPAQLRGLGPDQVLVLLNGKRRHTSSLVNINGTPGRGSVGTDLNAIPSFAIERVEVLRDGASAQYGSDAIAGVINVVMKKNTNQLTAAITAGAFNSEGSNDHHKGWDGDKYQLDLNYGTKIGSNGFINFTGSLMSRGDTRRARAATGTIFNAYNAIEQRALQNGVNINSLFSNINNTSNSQRIIDYIHQYAGNVNYFTSAQQSAIQSANSISALQSALNFDVTENELAYRGLTRDDFNMRIGQSKLKSGQLFVNSEFDITSGIRGYAFGGYSYRDGNAAGFFRRPNQSRTLTSVFPNGFLPEIASAVTDVSFAAGFKGKMGKVNYDISNTFGQNTFDYTIKNTTNSTMSFSDKTAFNAGSLGFSQNTINADFDVKFDWLKGFNVAFGGEARFEKFKISQGEESSWASYDINGNIVTPTTNASLKPTDFFGNSRPGGAQVFPGFRPENALNKGRSSVAAYVDTELDITDKWLLSAALRFENYSDFGSTFNYKIATRYKITDNLNFRAAHSTGFRAPSLQQIYFNSTSTQFVGGIPYEVGTFSNDSEAARILGIPSLKQEESKSFSVGFTAKIPQANLTFTVDGYYIRINDRVVLTDQFSKPSGPGTPGSDQEKLYNAFEKAGANAATFFANAIDTQTKGIEAVISHKARFGAKTMLNSDFALMVAKTNRVGNIHGSDLLINAGQINRYYSESSRVYLEEAIPRFKMSLNNTLDLGNLSFLLRNVYFGKVTDPNTVDVNGNGIIESQVINGQAVETEHPVWGGRIITDLSVGYKFSKTLKLTIGANNIFDVYPDLNYGPVNAKRPSGVDGNGNIVYPATASTIDLSNQNQFVYSRNVSQFGMNGRYLFARINLTF